MGTHRHQNLTDAGNTNMGNSIIMAWLIHSMVPKIVKGCLDMATDGDVWESVAGTYSSKDNYAQEFELRQSIDHSEQGEMTVLQYFMFLMNGWKRLNHLQDYKLVCATDSWGYKKRLEKVRVFKFLQGLH